MSIETLYGALQRYMDVYTSEKQGVIDPADAVNSGWMAEVETYQLTDTYTPGSRLGHEFWIATGLGYTTQAVELELSNALDAVGAQAPNARITHEMVGALPSTGAIRSG